MARWTAIALLAAVALWWASAPAGVLGVRLPARLSRNRVLSSEEISDEEPGSLLQLDTKGGGASSAAAGSGKPTPAPAGPRFVETHTATQHDQQHGQQQHTRSGGRGRGRARSHAGARVGDGWAYNFDEPPKTLQPPWAKAPEMAEFDLPAPPPAWTPPPPPPMGMYGEERAFPPPPSPPAPPPPPIPPPPPKEPEVEAGDDFLEKGSHAHRGGGKTTAAAGSKGGSSFTLPPPFNENSPFADPTMFAPPFAMPDSDAHGGGDLVDFRNPQSFPPPPGVMLNGNGNGGGGSKGSAALDVPPAEGSFVFPGLPPVPPLNSPNMPTPPQRAGREPSGFDPEEAVSQVPDAEAAARW